MPKDIKNRIDYSEEFEAPEIPKKPLIYIKDAGATISLRDIKSVIKDVDWSMTPEMHMVYSLIINKGMVSSKESPIGEITIAYQKEECRNKVYDAILETLMENNFKVYTV